MYQMIDLFLRELGLGGSSAFVAYMIALVAIAVICLLTRFVARQILVKIAGRVVRRTKSTWDDVFFKNRLFHRAADLLVPITISFFVEGMPQYGHLLTKIAQVAGVLVALLLFDSFTKSINEIYRQYEISRNRPIHGLLQVVAVFVYIIGGIVAVAILVGQSPMALLGGIGAMTAVTSFIFKDAILGFVAGIQLTGNDMIRIGDWIEMPKYAVNGTVLDLSMTTVKVENFDKTITSIPAYTLVSDAFINWRGMEASGGRRIKRAIYIDAGGIRLCDDAMIDHFRGIALLTDYIDGKLAEVAAYNAAHDCDLSEPVNGRRITNLGTFRAYIAAYLAQHPGVHHGMTCMVRQLDPDDRGIPLEIYAFTNTIAWSEYEGIQADIFDHLYSVVGQFGLQVYQRPSSGDIRSIGRQDE